MRPTYVAVGVSAALVVGLLTAALVGPNGLARHAQLRAELRRVQAINDQLRTENRRLSVERRALRHDARYLESVIRDDLGYIRPDEVVIRFAPPAAGGSGGGR